MKIIIKEENRDKLNRELENVQKRTKVRNIDVDVLFRIIKDVEFNLGIAKNKMVGVKVDADYNAQDFPNAYKYIPESTQVCIERFSKYWALTYVGRDRCRTSKARYILTLTDEAKQAIIETKIRFS